MTGINLEMNWGHAMECCASYQSIGSRFCFVTLDFDNWDHFEMHHYAFHVSDAEFDAIFGRIKEAGIPFGSGPFSQEDMQINHRRGGRGVYFKEPNGHVLELLTRE